MSGAARLERNRHFFKNHLSLMPLKASTSHYLSNFYVLLVEARGKSNCLTLHAEFSKLRPSLRCKHNFCTAPNLFQPKIGSVICKLNSIAPKERDSVSDRTNQ